MGWEALKCDVCDKDIPGEENTWHCKQHGFDCCEVCFIDKGLPGGYKLGDIVYSEDTVYSKVDAQTVYPGMKGTGKGRGYGNIHLMVEFEGQNGCWNLSPDQISRTQPDIGPNKVPVESKTKPRTNLLQEIMRRSNGNAKSVAKPKKRVPPPPPPPPPRRLSAEAILRRRQQRLTSAEVVLG